MVTDSIEGEMYANRTKQTLASGGTAVGCVVVNLPTPEVVRVLAASGFDYAFIDLEHSAIDLGLAHQLIRAAADSDITPIVRVGELAYSLVARVLDAGAQGIIFPRVEDPEILARAIDWTKFPRQGVRGFGLGPTQLGYRSHTFPEIIAHMNDNTLVVVQIETECAVRRRKELLSVGGVDVALIGPADLSISLGVPGDMEHPSMLNAIEECMDTCAHLGIAPGIQIRSQEAAERWIRRGMRFVGCGTDAILLQHRGQELVTGLRTAARVQQATVGSL